jgi:sister-chromatid-cohesion protein PDS5
MQLTPAQDIFNLFVTSILPALSDPSHAYNAQHKYVLVSLAEVKSIVLLTDLPNADSLMIHLFSNFFDTISGSTKASTGESIAKDVEYHMTQMLVTLVDESQSLPTDVIDVIVAQFLRAASPPTGKGKQELEENQSTLLMKELPEAYNRRRQSAMHAQRRWHDISANTSTMLLWTFLELRPSPMATGERATPLLILMTKKRMLALQSQT